jgi:hypothetical protein
MSDTRQISRDGELSDKEMVRRVRVWLSDRKETEIDTRWIRRACALAELHLSAPSEKQTSNEPPLTSGHGSQAVGREVALPDPRTKDAAALQSQPPDKYGIVSFELYCDHLGVSRVAIRYSDDVEEDRPASMLEEHLLSPASAERATEEVVAQHGPYDGVGKIEDATRSVRPKLTPLSPENLASRMPLPPEVLAGALQDKVDTKVLRCKKCGGSGWVRKEDSAHGWAWCDCDAPSSDGRREGHSALRVRDGKLETFDPHPPANVDAAAKAWIQRTQVLPILPPNAEEGFKVGAAWARSAITPTVRTHDGNEPAMLVAASWVKRIGSQQDWACLECVPHSDCLVAGFRCNYHRALAILGETEGTAKP